MNTNLTKNNIKMKISVEWLKEFKILCVEILEKTSTVPKITTLKFFEDLINQNDSYYLNTA